MKKLTALAAAALITVSVVSSSYAIAGIGFHWGFDLSLSMDDTPPGGERVDVLGSLLDDVGFDIPGVEDIAMFRVHRVNFDRSAINFGGKAYIDFIPVIDAIEISCNFGLWQYEGSLDYINPANLSPQAVLDGDLPYSAIKLGLGDYPGMKYLGLSGTPYAKLHFDVSVKKTLLNLWLIKFSGGAGVSAHFSTPLISGRLIEDVVNDMGAARASADLLTNGGRDFGKAIVQHIVDEALGKPLFGAHVLLGARVKLPAIPLGFYVDGKFMIPVSKFDENVDKSKSINGFGMLVNTGISLSI